MAQGNFKDYLRGDVVWVKKYFYVLRPLLAVRWIDQGRGPVPMLFTDLLATIPDEPTVVSAIEELHPERKVQYPGFEPLNTLFRTVLSETFDRAG